MEKNNFEITNFLLDNGADTTLGDKRGLNAHHCQKHPQPSHSPPHRAPSRKSSKVKHSNVSQECGFVSCRDDSLEHLQIKFEQLLRNKEEEIG